MEYTSGSLRLAKPQLSDAPDITRMNPNWDKIDENISGFNDKINVLSDEKAPKSNAKFTGTMTLNGNNVATTNKTEILFPYSSGITNISDSDISNISKTNNLVLIRINLKKTDSSSITTGTIIGSLPSGYRPSSHIKTILSDANANPILCEVFTTGNLRLRHNLSGNVQSVSGEVVYYV